MGGRLSPEDDIWMSLESYAHRIRAGSFGYNTTLP